MKQQTDIYIKLTTETDAEDSAEQIIDKLSTEVIAGCQVFSDILTAPVVILEIVGQSEGKNFDIVPLYDEERKAFNEILDHMIYEEERCYDDPDIQENHEWVQVLRNWLKKNTLSRL